MKNFLQLLIINYTFLIINCHAQQSGWEIIPSGTTQELNSVFFFDYEVGFAVGDSGTVIKSIDSGKTWQVLQPPTSYDLNDLYMFHRDTFVVVGNSGTIFFTTDGGASWSGNTNYIPEDILSISYSSGKGICGCSSQAILICTYTGTSHYCSTAQTGLFGGGFWGAYMLSPQIGFVAGENSIFQPLFGKSTDSGVNWDFTAFYLNNNEGRATGVDFTDINTGFVSARVWDGTGAIAKTTDGGSIWTSIIFTNPLWSIDFPISSASQVGYTVGSEGTILKTYDAGGNWQQQQSGTILKLNKIHFLDLDFGFAVGENGIILRTQTGGEPVTNVDESTLAVNEFKLEQNYPNPFNPSTKIKFTIPSVETTRRVVFTTLRIYDVLGNEIATLFNEEKPAGEYEIEFNSHSGEIRNLPSGVYFYQLRVGGPETGSGQGFIQTKKMLLLK